MDSDSDVGSTLSQCRTRIQSFIRSITPPLLKKMKKYLQKYKHVYQFKGKNYYKIVLYEDILSIVKLKENQQWIFNSKKNLKQIIHQVANQLKRTFITIKDRLRKKLSQLNNQQLAYLIQNNKSLVFRENTSVINTDDWPQHLKIFNRRIRSVVAASDNQNIIDLESSQRSNQTQRSNRSLRAVHRQRRQTRNNSNDVNQFKKKLQEKRKTQKTNVIKQIENIMSQSQGERKQKRPQSIKNTQKEKLITDQKIYDLQDPLEKEIFLDNVIDKWRNKHLDKSYFDSNKMLMQSKICYNFRQREYIFLNPQVMRSVWNNLNQQCLINVIKSKNSEKKDKIIHQQIQKEKNNDRIRNQDQDGIQYFSNLYEREEDIMRCTSSRVEEDQDQQTFKKNKTLTLANQRQSFYFNKSPIMQVSQIQESYKKDSLLKSNLNSQRSSEKNDMVKIKNPIKMIEQIASKYDINKAPKQVRELILKGIAISERLKRQSGQNVWKQLDIEQEQKDNNDIWLEQQDQPQKQRQIQINSQQSNKQESKPMIYWFNNDPDLYEIYQQRPYEMGHLLWTEQEDQILFKSNQNLQQNIDEFKSLIDEKTPKYLRSRIMFLKINPSTQLYTLISKYLQSDQ